MPILLHYTKGDAEYVVLVNAKEKPEDYIDPDYERAIYNTDDLLGDDWPTSIPTGCPLRPE